MPLELGVRDAMERRFSTDFSRVRVHTNTDMDAKPGLPMRRPRAYTVGDDVFIATGQPGPSTDAGERMLAHELVHVVQQRGRGSMAPGATQEEEARAAEASSRRVPVLVTGRSAARVPQCVGPPAPPKSRIIFLDNNVIVDMTDRGNHNVERTINALRAAGHKVYVPQQVTVELTQYQDAKVVAHRLAELKRLGLTTGPTGTMSARVDVHHANIVTPEGKVRERTIRKGDVRPAPLVSEPDPLMEGKAGRRNDALVAAQVKAAGGELWTYDTDYLTTDAKTKAITGAKVEITKPIEKGGLGMKVAAESWEVPRAGPTGPSGGGGPGGGQPGGGQPKTPAAPTTPKTSVVPKPSENAPPITPKPSAARSATSRARTTSTPAELGTPGSATVSEPPVRPRGLALVPVHETPGRPRTPEAAPVHETPVRPRAPEPAPVSEPPVRPRASSGKVAKAAAKGAGGAVLSMGTGLALTAGVLEMQRRQLQDSIARARSSSMARLQELRAKDPGTPVYIRLTIREGSVSQYVPLEGWVPAEDSLKLWSFSVTTDPIDPPQVKVDDSSLNLIRPGKVTWTTYTEPLELPAAAEAIEIHPELRAVTKLADADAIQHWVGQYDKPVVGAVTVDEKARLINVLLDGWVRDSDIAAIGKLYGTSPSDQRAELKRAIEARIPDLIDIGQRSALRAIANR